MFLEGRNGSPENLSGTPKDEHLVTAEWGGKPHSLTALPGDDLPGHPGRLRTQEMVRVAEPSSQSPDKEALHLKSLSFETLWRGESLKANWEEVLASLKQHVSCVPSLSLSCASQPSLWDEMPEKFNLKRGKPHSGP